MKQKITVVQALAYEACDSTCTPPHMPKTLETCNNVFYFSLSIKHKDLTRKSCVFICYFIGSVVKIVLYLHFLYTKDDRLRQIRKKHE